jgi:hypothetical protein
MLVRVREHIREGPQPWSVRGLEPARGKELSDLVHRPGARCPVHPKQCRKAGGGSWDRNTTSDQHPVLEPEPIRPARAGTTQSATPTPRPTLPFSLRYPWLPQFAQQPHQR